MVELLAGVIGRQAGAKDDADEEVGVNGPEKGKGRGRQEGRVYPAGDQPDHGVRRRINDDFSRNQYSTTPVN